MLVTEIFHTFIRVCSAIQSTAPKKTKTEMGEKIVAHKIPESNGNHGKIY